MFRIGDKVIDAYRASNESEMRVGTICGHHEGYYVVCWERDPKRRRHTCETAEDLLLADSPAVPLLADINKRIANLADEIERLRAEARDIVRSARGKQTRYGPE